MDIREELKRWLAVPNTRLLLGRREQIRVAACAHLRAFLISSYIWLWTNLATHSKQLIVIAAEIGQKSKKVRFAPASRAANLFHQAT